ncbi:hypothetical protein [Paenibacillus sp. FSL E2-0178]|uniref:hypothetical protein n=1 Tax=Paenibacillus sp. FSL E2-0178 TaxID=2921361 RepID=UPI0031595961
MLDALVYIMFSMVDGLAIIIFAFGSFKIDLKTYWKEIPISSTVISVCNFFLSRHDTLSNYSPILSMTLMFIFLLFFFRISVLSSVRITVIGFVAQTLTQGIMIYATSLLIGKNLETIKSDDFLRSALQLISGIALVYISVLLRKNRKYFTTLPYDYSYKIKFTKTNVILLFSSVVVTTIIVNLFNFSNFLIELIVLLFCFTNIIALETRKELREEID